MLKSIKIIIPGLFIFFIFPSFVSAEYFVINNFSTEIDVSENSILNVKETIEVIFSEPRHGIFRTVPFEYNILEDGEMIRKKIRISVINVLNENNEKMPYKVMKEGDLINLRIGDPDFYVDGKQVYKIEYEVLDAVKRFDDHDEIYWNATGNEWPVSILKASALIKFPKANYEWQEAICFTGIHGSNIQNCEYEKIDNNFLFTSNKALGSYEGLTIAVSIPKGILLPVSIEQEILYFLRDNYGVFLPILTLLIMIFVFFRFGRDPNLHKTVIAFYEPPDNLSPAEVGTIIDESADMKDISAEIIYLAVNGYLKIQEGKEKGIIFKTRDYTLIKTPDKTKIKLNAYQKEIMEGIFGTKQHTTLKNLKNKFYTHVFSINELLYKSMLNRKYFLKNPNTIRIMYLVAGILIGVAILIPSAIMERFDFVIGGILSGIIIVLFSFFMSKKTRKGAETYWKAMGFKEYIDTAEKYRVKFQENKHIFEEFLPYAMVFGIADKWGNAFKDIYKNPPDWYQGRYPDHFNTAVFLASMNNLSSSMKSTLTSTPSSSGSSSGFSGGGCGGGGGGSW